MQGRAPSRTSPLPPLDAKGISAKTKPYFYLNAFLREFVGLLVEGWWRHLAFSVLIIGLLLGLQALSVLQIQ